MDKKLCLLLAMALGLGLEVQAQTYQARALPVLEMGADARTVAMGGSHYGLSKSAHLYTNPVSMALGNERVSVGAGWRHQSAYTGLSGSLDTYSLSAGFRLGRHALMIGGRYFQSPKVTGMNSLEVPTNPAQPRDYTLDLGYALRLGRFALYGTGSYVSSDLGGPTAQTFVFGVGLFYRHTIEMSGGDKLGYLLGVKGQNMGPYFRYSKGRVNTQPPCFVGLGGELSYEMDERHKLTLSLGGEQHFMPYRAMSTVFRGGAEYQWHRTISIRTGYMFDTDRINCFSLGAGLRFRALTLDAAYLTEPIKGAGGSLHLTLGFNI